MASTPLLAVPTAYVIPVATARLKERVYTTTLALRNDGQKDAQCEAIYAIPNDPKGGTLRAKYMVPAGGQPRVDEDVLRQAGVAGTMRLDCSGEIVVITRIQSSADQGSTFDSGWTFPGMREDDAIARGKVKTLTALHDVVVAEVAGRPVTVEAIARNSGGMEVGRKTYEILPFLQKIVEMSNVRDDLEALTVELRVVSGDGAIVAADENRDPELIKMATRMPDESHTVLNAHQSVQTSAASSPATGPTVTQMLLLSPFKGAPFQDPMTGLILMRDRWYDPKTGTFITPDPEGNRDSANLYSFAGGDPVNQRDPTGLCLGLDKAGKPCSAYFEAALGLFENFGRNLIPYNPQIPATGKAQRAIGKVLRAVGAPSVVLLNTGSATGELGYRLELATFHGERSINPASVDDNFLVLGVIGDGATFIAPTALLKGGLPGRVAARETETVTSSLFQRFEMDRAIARGLDAQRALAQITAQVNARLAANPALAQSVLSLNEYQAATRSANIARIQYGNAVERLVAKEIRESVELREVFRHVGGPNNPDFVAFGQNYDVTTGTMAQVYAHMRRPGYGPALGVVTYTRPPTFTTFPTVP
jgi:RHS repeat-associated protein